MCCGVIPAKAGIQVDIMATTINMNSLNDLQQIICSVIAERFPGSTHTIRTKDELCIEIAAKHTVVGPLSIFANKDGATVVVSYFHHHFDDYLADKDTPRSVLVAKIATAVCE